MIGIELDRPCGELVNRAMAQGLLINVTVDSVIRLLPPLVMPVLNVSAPLVPVKSDTADATRTSPDEPLSLDPDEPLSLTRRSAPPGTRCCPPPWRPC